MRAPSRLSAWLGVVALLLQTLVPLVHQPPAQAALSPFGEPAALCLASAADTGHSLPSDHDKAPAEKSQPCAICLTLHLAGGFLPPSSEIALQPPVQTGTVAYLAQLPVHSRWTETGTQARAPPVTA